MVEKVVTEKRASVRVQGMTYKAVVQKVIIYRRERCVVMEFMLKVL